jgi:hypothetical protein
MALTRQLTLRRDGVDLFDPADLRAFRRGSRPSHEDVLR